MATRIVKRDISSRFLEQSWRAIQHRSNFPKSNGQNFVSSQQRWFQSRAVEVSMGGAGLPNITRPVLLEKLKHYGKCFYELSKARLSLLVVITGSAGYALGSGETVDTEGLICTSVGTMMAAASANSFNQIMEIKNDSLMKRTMKRPLPSGRLSKHQALLWAVGMGVSGVSLLAYKANFLTAGLGAANIGLYSLVYTPLKQIHPINTWVGAVVGAIPPLMGWSAAAGQLDPGAYVLAAGLYFWQLPHFMALAWLCKKDYASGGYKMLSLMDPTGKRTAAVALRNSLYLLPLGFMAAYLGVTSDFFAYENLALTAGMAASSAIFCMKPSPETARKTFRFSLLYLPLLMAAMLAHRLPNPSAQKKDQKADHSVELVEETKGKRERPLLKPELDWRGEMYPENTPRPPVAYLSAAPFPFLPLPGPSHRF